MSTTFNETRFEMCRSRAARLRQVRAEHGDEVARAICCGDVDAIVAMLELICGAEKTAEYFYRVADDIVRRNPKHIEPNQYEV